MLSEISQSDLRNKRDEHRVKEKKEREANHEKLNSENKLRIA